MWTLFNKKNHLCFICYTFRMQSLIALHIFRFFFYSMIERSSRFLFVFEKVCYWSTSNSIENYYKYLEGKIHGKSLPSNDVNGKNLMLIHQSETIEILFAMIMNVSNNLHIIFFIYLLGQVKSTEMIEFLYFLLANACFWLQSFILR